MIFLVEQRIVKSVIVKQVFIDFHILFSRKDIIKFEDQEQKIVYVICEVEQILNYFDIIENCPALTNLIIFQSIINELELCNRMTFNNLKNLIENSPERKIYIFANNFKDETYLNSNVNIGKMEFLQRQIVNCCIWYQQHLQQIGIRVMSLCNSFQLAEHLKLNNIETQTIYNFIKINCQEYPYLQDYLGFEEEESEQLPILFEDYFQFEQIQIKIKSGELFQGKILINKNNKEEGVAIIEKYGIEIKIVGKNNLNRALCGDIVAIQLLPQNQWQQLQNYFFIDNQDDIPFLYNNQSEMLNQEVNATIIEDSYDESIQTLFSKIKINQLIPFGKIVGIIKRTSKQFCGRIQEQQQFENNVLFNPSDKRFPNFFIRLQNVSKYKNKLIMIYFDNWKPNSQYPKGHFMKEIGNVGDINAEQEVILLEHKIDYKNFSQKVLSCLPLELEKWQIPQSEIEKRIDLRQLNICSVDPPMCKDIDDALHCIELSNGNFQIGVHIADVTYFVKADEPLDLEARYRCTTVYLIDRRTDMLPKILTENLCSLISNQDRLAFSVVWEISPQGIIQNVQYFKSVINSKASLTYQQAQERIDNIQDQSEVTIQLRNLKKIAKILREKRIENGAITLASTQIKFQFEEETHNPIDVSFYQVFDTNSMIEEYMLLANVYVAEKIIQHFPQNSILRRHTTPKENEMKKLQELLQAYGFKFQYYNSKALADSLDLINQQNFPFFNQLIRILTTRCMNEAQYFCSSDLDQHQFHHYGLACPFYTHFTSPIRRYADILVHRMLSASLDLESLPLSCQQNQKLTKICNQMNCRNRNARYASKSSSNYYSYQFFKDKEIEDEAIFIGLQQTGVEALCVRYGLEGIILFDQKDLKLNQQLQQQNQGKPLHQFYLQGEIFQIFDRFKARIQVSFQGFHKEITITYIEKWNQ